MVFRHCVPITVWLGIVIAWGGAFVASQEPEEDEEVSIRDNSFLIEEAYNQDPGVVQNIFNAIPVWDREGGVRQNQFNLLFTQEWPLFSQRHQFSYSLPVFYSAERPETGPLEEMQGFGDLFLNYRYQLFDGEGDLPAVAPRFSVILRTGEAESGHKSDVPGYQLNLPISKEFEHWALHANAGWTTIPDLHPELPGLAPLRHAHEGYNLGGSVIRFLRPDFHLMLEALALWEEEATPLGERNHRFEMLVNPGFRWAPYTEGDTQFVVGLGVPIAVSGDAPDVSLFIYMSFEQRFRKKQD